MPATITLGLDTSTAATAVALRTADGRTNERRDDPPPGERPRHAGRLLALAHDLLEEADLSWADLDRIAVGRGPGTFTGLRIGIATARGLGLAAGAPVVGISSLRVLAQGAACVPAATSAAPGGSPIPADAARALAVLAILDARRGEVFVAGYNGDAEAIAPRALAPAALAELLGQPATATPGSWLAVGDGAVRFRQYLPGPGVRIPPDDSPLHRVSAGVLCQLAARLTTIDPRPVTPDYLRSPDAELALRHR